MLSDKGTENSKQLVTTESPLGLKKILLAAARCENPKTQWGKWERILHLNAGAPSSAG